MAMFRVVIVVSISVPVFIVPPIPIRTPPPISIKVVRERCRCFGNQRRSHNSAGPHEIAARDLETRKRASWGPHRYLLLYDGRCRRVLLMLP